MTSTVESRIAFRSEHLDSRRIALQDKANIIALYTNANVMRYIDLGAAAKSGEDIFANIQKANQSKSPKGVYWGIFRRSDNAFIGLQGLTFDPNNKQRAEIGIMLFPQFSGAGLATEALSGMIKHGFEQLHFTQLFAHYDANNQSVKRLAQRLKFDHVVDDQCNITKQHWQSLD